MENNFKLTRKWKASIPLIHWKASKSGSGGEKAGSGCEDLVFKQQIGSHGSQLDAISLGSRSRLDADGSRLDGFDLAAAAGCGFTWQQQIVVSAIGGNIS